MSRVNLHISTAEYIADTLVELGIRHVFGVGGANIEDVFLALQRRRPQIAAILDKHEHAAGTAADAYARISGGLGVVLATSGGGALNLAHSLAEARASQVPLLAIVGEPPRPLQGAGAFQDTSAKGPVDAVRVLGAVAKSCVRVEEPEDVPRLLSEALVVARAYPKGPAVLVMAKDVQEAPIAPGRRILFATAAAPLVASAPKGVELATARAALLLAQGPNVVIAGDAVARDGAREQLLELVDSLGASVAVTPDGRDAFDNRDPRFLGVTGGMGHPEVLRAVAAARAVVLVGTRLPLLARQGLEGLLRERPLIAIGLDAPFVAGAELVPIALDTGAGLTALERACSSSNPRPVVRDARVVTSAVEPTRTGLLDSREALRAVERAAPEGSVLLVDAGNTGASAVHVLRPSRTGRWLIAMGMAGMGYTFGAAVGAALASGKRCIVLAGDGAFFMHGFEIHTALEHALPITYVIFNNNAHGMCLVRERLLLKADAGYNRFRASHLGAALGAMFPGVEAADCRTLAELEAALARSIATPGPAVVSVELDDVEVPPFAAFQSAGGAAFARLETRGTP